MDRRVKRTRTAVFNAVLDLLTEKDASKITVLEVCKRADINKSTFYLHYTGISDCLQKCFAYVTNGVVEFAKHIKYEEIKKNPKPVVDKILEEVERSADYFTRFKLSNITGNSAKIFKQSVVDAVVNSNGFTLEDNYFEIATINFAVGGCFDTIIGMFPNFDKDEISKVICAMLQSSRAKYNIE